MVGIVIVSHSAGLAEGVAELARAMAGPDVRLATAGGLDLPDNPLGTDAMRVLRAIEEVYSSDGVVVLMDLGSSLLSAEMALEFLDEDRRAHVALCSAPLVEGAVAAAVQSRLGSPLDAVVAEALTALTAKGAHLAQPQTPAAELSLPQPGPEPPAMTIRLVVRNRLGLHARPAARLVQTVARYDARVRLRVPDNRRGPVDAHSINAVATLGVRQGDEIEFSASGPQAVEVLAALRSLADADFGDMDDAVAGLAPTEGDSTASAVAETTGEPATIPSIGGQTLLRGLPASPGIALGPARHMRVQTGELSLTRFPAGAGDPQGEWKQLLMAIEQARVEIQATQRAVSRLAQPGRAPDRAWDAPVPRASVSSAIDIFEVHLLFLEDEALLGPAREDILHRGASAAFAWQQTVERMAAAYGALDDPYLRSRAADVLEVGRLVLGHLPGIAETRHLPQESGILLADDLSAAEVAQLDSARVQGIGTVFGGPTSHSMILARSLGIPAVVGLGKRVDGVPEGTLLVLDGEAGRLLIDPDEDARNRYAQRAQAQRLARSEALASRDQPAITTSGRRLRVLANIGSVDDAGAAIAAGAEGVGVLRTEFLFLDRQTAPDEEEQYAAYVAIARALEGRPLTIRTLDVGGDKPLPYLPQPPENNPFLGWRAIRLSLSQPELFQAQLRAIWRTAIDFPVQVLFPMIATVEEWHASRDQLRIARDQLRARGLTLPSQMEAGIMVEVPAAALQAQCFEADFYSLGTNDLAQYVLAAERGNPHVASLSNALQPAVLRLIQEVVKAAHARSRWVAVCGELASDLLAVPLLVGLGVDELSMTPAAIPEVKRIIRRLDDETAGSLAERVLSLPTAEAVRKALREFSTRDPSGTRSLG